MATGFRLGSTVYLLSTDAVMFEEEMDRLAEQLEGILKSRRDMVAAARTTRRLRCSGLSLKRTHRTRPTRPKEI